jgi:TonB family protein
MKLLFWGVLAAAMPFWGQEWTPTRIVAITDYAPLARAARIAGEVEVRCLLDANGSVIKAEALSGHPILQEQARQNAILWKFRRTSPPEGSKNTVSLKYKYVLEGERQDRARTTFVVDLPNSVQIITPPPLGDTQAAIRRKD